MTFVSSALIPFVPSVVEGRVSTSLDTNGFGER
jgi:hypothetical protein